MILNETLISNQSVRQNMMNEIVSSALFLMFNSLFYFRLEIVIVSKAKNNAGVDFRSRAAYIGFELNKINCPNIFL